MPPQRYIVRRDGNDRATVPADTLSFKDSALSPLTQASYTVVAVTQGRTSDPTPALQVTTLAPAISEARLEGDWEVALKVTKNSGTRLKLGDTTVEPWTFAPKCSTGPCPANLSGTIAGQPFTVTMARAGAVYKGSTTAHIARCGSTDTVNKITVVVKVTDGGVSGGDWAAADWTGTLDLSIPYTRSGSYYCPAQSAQFTATPGGTGTPQPTT